MKLERRWPYIYFLCLTIFFIPCLTFVGLRGYKCFIKYFNKPEAFKVSFQFSGNEYFPSLTFCSNREDTYDSDIFTECQVSLNDYTKMGPWVGKGSPNCTDPKILYDRAVIKIGNLGIKMVQLYTFSKKYAFDSKKLLSLKWNVAPFYPTRKCYTMTIPKEILKEGIEKVEIKSKTFGLIYLHQKGLFRADMTGASIQPIDQNKMDGFAIDVSHESRHMLNYNGNPCNGETDYKYDECKQEYIYKVNIFCLPV